MQSNFIKFIELVLETEGGFVDDPDDPGGATNKGITLKTFSKWSGKEKSVEELKNIEDTTVRLIYEDLYWKAVQGRLLPDGVDIYVADWAVHSGPTRATMELQKILEVDPDGVIGPITLDALKRNDGNDILLELHLARIRFLHDISYGKPTFKFLKGWLNRIHHVYKEIVF